MDKRWFSFRHFKIVAAALAALSLLQSIAIIAQAAALAKALHALFRGEAAAEAAWPLCWFLAAYAARHAFVWLERRAAGGFAEDAAETVRTRLLARLFELGSGYAAKQGSGMLVTLALDGVNRFRRYMELSVPRALNMGLVTLPVLIFIYTQDPLSGLILTVTMPILVGFFILLGFAARKRADKQWRSYRVLSHHFTDSLRGLLTLRFLGRSRSHGETIERVSEQYRSATMGTLRVAFLSSFALDFFSMLSIAFVAVGLGLRLIEGQIGLEAALTVLILAPEYFLPVRNLGADYHASLDGKEAYETIRAVGGQAEAGKRRDGDERMASDERRTGDERAASDEQAAGGGQAANGGQMAADRRAAGDGPAHADRSPQTRFAGALPLGATIRIKDITVLGDAGSRPLLDGVNVVLPQGARRIGIVGESGAGKSTLLGVLGGFVQPDAGEVTIDGRVLDGAVKREWQSQVAFIPQHPYLYSMSLRDNMRFYEPEAGGEQVARAIRAAGLEEVIARLPGGADTPIGEGGRGLSGGQAQRVALARALVGNRPVLLFDEPTAHLDIETEWALKQTMLSVFEDKRAFIATHRLHWMPDMDEVWVLERGQLVEHGPHHQLIRQRGAYYRLYMAQNEGRQSG